MGKHVYIALFQCISNLNFKILFIHTHINKWFLIILFFLVILLLGDTNELRRVKFVQDELWAASLKSPSKIKLTKNVYSSCLKNLHL